MQDNIHEDSLDKLNNAVQKAARLVGSTMGPGGRNVLIEEKLQPFWSATNDGATIIERMKFEDPVERIGHAVLKEATTRSNNNAGDGSSTTTVVTAAIVKGGLEAKDIQPMQLKKQLDECLPIIEKSIAEQTKQITVEDIPKVAYIAGEDRELADTLGEIYKYIGKEGIISLESSGTYETTYNFIEGVRFQDTGYLSPYMVHDEESRKEGRKESKAIYEKPVILVTKRKIANKKEANKLLMALYQQNIKNLVIFTDDMDSDVAAAMVNHHLATKMGADLQFPMNILIIKAPILWKNYVFEDFAKITGATIVEDSTGVNWGNLEIKHFGACDKIIVDKEETTVIGIKDIADHIAEIKADESLPSQDKSIRLAYLTTKTCILRLGAKSESELAWKKLKCEDAVFSCRRALEGGVVPGGGITLKKAADALPDTIGGNILKEALKAPTAQICANMGIPEPDSFEEWVIDSAPIVVGAVRNSIGIASTLLTTSSIITLPPEKEKSVPNPFGF